ncbi:MAG: hypothetical protein AVDCRST_MAG72-2238 [uncultured Nocardioidaceae bacterium]|uniref:N-acetyltransferase domain-containing protein n=1 Tax=uncultured Nocardioidaceae bacterium TaxID=253824 RepID=A0A6J4MIU6_9ACTN|nr:MAG: hypothetical protein AVDCRST_MAG72-2238 [uncultured Nocardioidaceae bacterium]
MAVDYYVRRMREEDVTAVERLTDEAFYQVDVRTHRAGSPEPTHRSEQKALSWRRRLAHLVHHDPDGCWIAEDRTGVIGAAASIRRDLTWILSAFAVRPDRQGRGVGRQLLDAALAHGSGCLRAMLAASDDPGAVRRYRLAGFSLHPTMALRGTVDRRLLPVVERVREGAVGDVDLMNSVDRQVRDAAHGVDHELLVATYRLVVVDRATGTGYAYVEPNGGPHLLAATNRRTAADLLWESLASSSPDASSAIRHLTPAQEWAVDIGLAARMELDTEGYLALRSMKPPVPYIPSGHFL